MVNGGRADYMGMGCEEAKIFYHIFLDLLNPFGEIWEYAREISGNSQENDCARVWEPC